MAFPDSATLTGFVQPLIQDRGLDVEDIKTTRARKKSQVIIRVDGDRRPTSDVLEEVSDLISQRFDAAEASGELNFGAGYTLEVSTPGVDLPLSAPRHFRRNQGRQVAVELADAPGQRTVWRLGALNPDNTEVIVVRTVKKDLEVEILRLANIARAVVEIEFAQPSAAELEVAREDFEHAAERVSA